MLGWLKALVSPQAGEQVHLLRRFGIADPTITRDGVIAEADLWRIDSRTERTVHLFEVPVSGLERCILTYRAQIRTIDSLGRVYLEMWCRVPGRDEFSSRGLQHAVTGGSEWAACETPCFLKAGERPDLIRLNVVCAGTVLIKEIELLHTPLK
jgi:hypothetical protein